MASTSATRTACPSPLTSPVKTFGRYYALALGQWFNQMGRNVEMTNYTQALYDARELSMERMQSEAVALNAQGVVGAQIVEHSHGWGSHVIEFFAVGTAVVSVSDNHQIQPPALALLLND